VASAMLDRISLFVTDLALFAILLLLRRSYLLNGLTGSHMVDQIIDNTLPPAFFKHYYHHGLMFIWIIDGTTILSPTTCPDPFRTP